jgi:hypothetical protein
VAHETANENPAEDETHDEQRKHKLETKSPDETARMRASAHEA